MTRHYLTGEFSLLLEELRTATRDPAAVRDLTRLRNEAEAAPPEALTQLTPRVFQVSDRCCWRSLARGDLQMFARQTAVSANLWELAVCAGVIDEPPAE